MKPFKSFLTEANTNFNRKEIQEYLKGKADVLKETIDEIESKYKNNPGEMSSRVAEINSAMISHLMNYIEKNHSRFAEAAKNKQYTEQELMDDINFAFSPIMGNIAKALPNGGFSLSTHSTVPQAQQQTPTFFASQQNPSQGLIKPHRIVFQNIPQGATKENPLGREGMTETEYTKPDNFNRDFDEIFKSIFGP